MIAAAGMERCVRIIPLQFAERLKSFHQAESTAPASDACWTATR
jgi:hypothetical protein